MRALNILHVFRAPVGGLFRHVVDLARGQAARGHRVGLITDSNTGGAMAEEILGRLAPDLALGLTRIPMSRIPGLGDLTVVAQVTKRIGRMLPDVVHGHGAKGGAYARLACGRGVAVRAYTPHGGSLWFSNDTLGGRFYLAAERLLMRRGNLYLFESAYTAEVYRQKVGAPPGTVRIVHNGVSTAEFEPVALVPNAADLLFLGELREVKGIDVLIDALALLRRNGRAITATLIGGGPKAGEFHAQIARLGLGDFVQIRPPMPARQAFSLGRVMTVPSRMESLPYVVLEAAAAGKPLIATRVGGIPEIYSDLAGALIPPDDVDALAKAIVRALDQPEAAAADAKRLQARIAAGFSVDVMVEAALAAYQAALEPAQR